MPSVQNSQSPINLKPTPFQAQELSPQSVFKQTSQRLAAGLSSTTLKSNSTLKRLLQIMLPAEGLSVAAQKSKAAEICRRSEAMGYTGRNRLFEAVCVNSPIPHIILQPKVVAKLVIADHYREKYGVEIFVDTGHESHDQSLNWVGRLLKRHEGKPIGFIFFQEKFWNKGTKPELIMPYDGHVTPMIFQKLEKHVECINLDSCNKAAFQPFQLNNYFKKAWGISPKVLTLGPARQADWYSCHSYSSIVLKDGLKHLMARQPNGKTPSSSIEWFTQEDEDARQSIQKHNLAVGYLPSVMHKATQRQEALQVGPYKPHALVRPTELALKLGTQKTIDEHRKTFNRFYRETHFLGGYVPGQMLINHYLNIKAYHTAETVLRRLESMGDQASRDAYIQALRENNEGKVPVQPQIKGSEVC